MKIIYWTITWFGLDITYHWIDLHYLGTYTCYNSKEVSCGLVLLLMLGIWVVGCLYYATEE